MASIDITNQLIQTHSIDSMLPFKEFAVKRVRGQNIVVEIDLNAMGWLGDQSPAHSRPPVPFYDKSSNLSK